MYIPYATSSHEKTGDIINYAQFEEDDLVENGFNAEEYKLISYSIDEFSTDDDPDDGSISTNALEEIWDGSKINLGIKARDARLKIHNPIRQNKNEWKGAWLSVNILGKGLHKVFNSVVNELNNVFPTMG